MTPDPPCQTSRSGPTEESVAIRDEFNVCYDRFATRLMVVGFTVHALNRARVLVTGATTLHWARLD